MDSTAVYNIPEFCKSYRISRALLYKLWSNDQGPARIQIGGRVVIEKKAAEKWALSLTTGAF